MHDSTGENPEDVSEEANDNFIRQKIYIQQVRKGIFCF